ncbi:MAG: hypothetical protein JO329_19375 [Planctomycetaceae bacterium]|nr:hypothetical protein [Planctomycetaceae bacterium]
MLGMPEPTAYDLKFRVLGIPVRVHPLFWLVTVLLSRTENLKVILIWTACVFASILVHELGHGLMARSFGSSPAIVLHSMGGLCFSEPERLTPWQRLVVILGGPGAQLVLLGVILLAGGLFFRITPGEDLFLIGNLLGLSLGGAPSLALAMLPETTARVFIYLVEINLLWALLNLFPVWPLDGGQAAGILLSMHDRRRGMHRAHVISLLTAGLLAMWMLQKQEYFMALFFGYFALINYQVLHVMHQSARYDLFEDDAGWWKR